MPVKNKKQIINIVGWGGSGKSVLHSLLDGHPEILSDPIHTKIVDGFANFNEKNVAHKDIRTIRKHLELRGYYNIEAIAFKNVLSIPMSSRPDDMITIPFLFDFYRFESSWVDRLSRLEKWSADSIVSILYEEYGKELNLSNTCARDLANRRYVSTMGKVSLKNMKKIKSQHPNLKTILVKRNVEDIIATRVNRPTPKGFCKTDIGREWHVILLRGEIQRINNYYRFIEKEEFRNPRDVKVIDFNDLVLNTEKTMRSVSDFLDIEYTSDMTIPTCFSLNVSSNNCSYVGEVNDSAELLLSKERRFLIKIINKASSASKLFATYTPFFSLILLKLYQKIGFFKQ
jgi:hypothetical protein